MAFHLLTAQQMFDKYESKLGNTEHHLWGQHIRSESVTYLVGETCVGKTTLLYNLCYHLSRGEAFLNIAPPRPLRILHIDYESSGENCVEALWNIGHDSPNWVFPDLDREVEEGGSIHGPAMMHFLSSIKVGEFDMFVIDPLLEAYPVSDENNNVEAAAQMLAFRKLARSKKVGVVLVHNTGKSFNNPKTGQEQSAVERAGRKFLGRGAAARQDKADVGINYVKVDDTTRMMQVVKSRTSNLGTQWTLAFNGNHGFNIKSVSHLTGVSQTLPLEKDEKLRNLLSTYPDLSLRALYEEHVKPTLHISQATFYRRVQEVRTRVVPPAGSPVPPV